MVKAVPKEQVELSKVGSVIVGILLTAVSLDSSSFPGILIMLGVHNDKVFTQTSGDASSISDSGKILSSQLSLS